MNKEDSEETVDKHCTDTYCYGVVKEYEYGGVREAPEEIEEQKNSLTRKFKELVYPHLNKEVETITWHECSMCHKHHPEFDE